MTGVVTIVTGGVGDTPILDECMEVGTAMGMYMAPIRDISVDGLQRTMGNIEGPEQPSSFA
jgi:NCAIR mutase (PurE)-related protein